MPITSTILRVSDERPDQLAIVGAHDRLSYAALVQDSRRVIAAVRSLHESQQHPPEPVAETMGIPVTAISVASAFHTSRIIAGLAGYRAISATIDPRWPLEHRVGVILSTGIGLVISDASDLADALAARGWGGTIISLDDFRALEARVEPAEHPTVRDGEEPFLLLFSSGTTSNPKAFLKTRDQYRANLAISTANLEPYPGVATLAPGPVSYSLTLYALVECLATGGSAHMADAFDPIAMGTRIRDEHITRVVAVPAIVQALADAARRHPDRFTSIELIVTGGANLAASVRENIAKTLPGVRLISYYGAAEIGFIGDSREGDGTLINIYEGVEAEIRDGVGEALVADAVRAGQEVRAGGAQTEHEAQTRDTAQTSDTVETGDTAQTSDTVETGDTAQTSDTVETGDTAQTRDTAKTGQEVQAGDLGTLWIRTPACSYGYVAGPADAQLRGPDGWATVHDQGRMVNGKLQLVGRADDIAVTGGHKVALPEVERAFDDLAGLGSVCAVALEHARLGSVVALVVEGEGLPKEALQAHARDRLAPQFVPRRWYRIPAIPRTVGGKIRRAATAELVAKGEAERL